MSDIPILFLRKITKILPCNSDLNPSQQSSSSGDLRPEMMESETPPPAVPSCEVGDPEVSSWRASPDPVRPEDNPIDPRSPQYPALKESKQKSPAPSGMRSDILRELVGRAAISEEHRTLMGTVMERISSAESRLHEAFRSLLTGFEVREIICDSTAHVRCALCR